jgi:hypothetical protein
MPRFGSIENGFIVDLVVADDAETAQAVLGAQLCVELPEPLPDHAMYDYDSKTFVSNPPVIEGTTDATV